MKLIITLRVFINLVCISFKTAGTTNYYSIATA